MAGRVPPFRARLVSAGVDVLYPEGHPSPAEIVPELDVLKAFVADFNAKKANAADRIHVLHVRQHHHISSQKYQKQNKSNAEPHITVVTFTAGQWASTPKTFRESYHVDAVNGDLSQGYKGFELLADKGVLQVSPNYESLLLGAYNNHRADLDRA